MKYRRLGRSDIFISRICAGGVVRGDERAFIRALHLSFDHGVNAVDTAPMYGCGVSELAVGKAIAAYRHRIFVMTKCGVRWDDPHGRALWTIKDADGKERVMHRNSRPESLRLEVDRSLSRLGVDHIDVLQLHVRDPDTPLEDTMGALAALHREGKIRAVGVSNFSKHEVAEAVKYLGSVPLAAAQTEYSLIARTAERELFGDCLSHGRGLLACSVLGQGALTDRVRSVPDDSRQWAAQFAFSNRARIARVIERVVAPIAQQHRATVAQIALAWVLAHEEVTSAIVGASGHRQALENVTAIDVALSREDVREVGDAFARAGIDPNASHTLIAKAERILRRVVGG